MSWQFRKLTASVLLLAAGAVAVNAQQVPGTPVPDDERQMQQGQRVPPGRYSRSDEPDDWDDRRGPGMMDRNPDYPRGSRRQHAPAAGTMAFDLLGGDGGPGMLRLMMILMDSDGDGAVSLQEFQAGHERMFKAMDADKDGRLTLEEVQGFGRSLRRPGQQQLR